VTPSLFQSAALVLLLSSSASAQQVVFSRRVYAAQGHTHQQVWIWSATDGSLKPLTNSPRDHNQPMCSRDGQQIFFSSGATWFDQGIWSFDRATGAEHEVLAASTWNRPALLGMAADGRLLVTRCSGPFQKYPSPCTPIVESHPGPAAPQTRYIIVLPLPEHGGILLSPDGVRLLVNTPPGEKQTHAVSPLGVRMEALNLHTFVTDAPTALSRADLPPCDRPVWSPDGSRLACAAGQDITIVDVDTQKEIERIRFSEHDSRGEPYATPPEPAAWSADGRTLLVGTYGENGSSSSPQSDYFVVDLATKSWTRATTGNDVVWLPGRNTIVYSTPRDLAPLAPSGAHSVWSAHLAIFDLDTHEEKLLTSGVTNNEQPTLCGP
jgi:Tol biopolymer transport system component